MHFENILKHVTKVFSIGAVSNLVSIILHIQHSLIIGYEVLFDLPFSESQLFFLFSSFHWVFFFFLPFDYNPKLVNYTKPTFYCVKF